MVPCPSPGLEQLGMGVLCGKAACVSVSLARGGGAGSGQGEMHQFLVLSPQITSAFDMEAVTFKKLVKGHAYSVTGFTEVSGCLGPREITWLSQWHQFNL